MSSWRREKLGPAIVALVGPNFIETREGESVAGRRGWDYQAVSPAGRILTQGWSAGTRREAVADAVASLLKPASCK